MVDSNIKESKKTDSLVPDLPLVVWMILITLCLGLINGYSSKDLISLYNSGWGYATGELALILMPSFVLAAALERQRIQVSARFSVGLAPFAGAGLVCPDTAYAALSPMIRRRKLSMAFGVYAGFKLLFPAGPLLIATSLGVTDGELLAVCILIFVPVWAVGVLYGMIVEARVLGARTDADDITHAMLLHLLWPFVLLAGLLTIGVAFDMSFNPWLDFVDPGLRL